MKFGEQIKAAAYQEWRYYYLDYDAAKKLLKEGRRPDGKFNDDDEANFVQKLEAELEKVAAFRKIKGDELTRRLQHVESLVKKILGSTHEEDPLRFQAVEDEIIRITVEVNELSKFIRVNYTGFFKILKKHDKHMDYILKPMFNTRLESHPFYKDSFDPIIIRLSKVYDIVRSGGEREKVSSSGAGSQNFVRRTTKYWVHPDNVTEVKCIILKYLPVLLFSAKSGKAPNPAITSIYFDNDQFELYQGRIEKTEGAEAHRIRWYGGMDQTEIFIERKTHREDWTGESSVKERFSIKEKYVNDFIKGTYSMDKAIKKIRERGQKTEKELEDLKTLADDIQQGILKKKLHPMIRTFYNRTAFQLPGDARVRISLDTELTMVREDNYDKKRSGDNWRRMDLGVDYPFTQLDPEDVNHFPYAILEVKLQTQAGAENPKWVEELINSHLVEEVPKFSKFIHGCATLLESHINLLPFWLPQMDKDIKKPSPQGYVSQLTGRPNSPNKSNLDVRVENYISKKESKKALNSHLNDHTEVTIEDQTENTPLLAASEDYDYDSETSRRKLRQKKSFLGKVGDLFRDDGDQSSSTIAGFVGRRGQPPQKKIALPVRIEPKVFFANERTFLSWLHFCTVLGALSVGLLNLGDKVAMISGLIFTVVAILFMLYALFLYQWRAHKIRNRDAGPYDDRFGPTLLVFVLFFALMANFYLKFNQNYG
ncbi:vacuolar transporter chaperone [Clydaea vesicula]|uniref:Vacuolar transporter chaperone complex subunit 4 n=1 Tax=Clydaea vesicula TaxID=447962 RepID=A0AAD5TYU7_9FUNG|nr:vacuolar transporter chaperone [Clydaea vesicula]